MRHWIDHTGIHQFSRCFAGRGHGQTAAHAETEISGFLQLATQLVFSDKITFSNLETPEVQAQSQSIVSLLIDHGLPTNVFVPARLQVSDYKAACINATAKYVEELEAVTSENALPDQALLEAARPDFSGRFANYIEESHRILTDDLGLWQLDEILAHILETERSGGAEKFMVAALRQLHDSAWSKLVRPGWSLKRTHDLCVRLRYYLNQELAASARGVYVPAIARARVVHRHAATILGQLERVYQKSVVDLQPEGIGLPSIAQALVRLAKAEPKAIAGEAIAARAKSVPLRAALAQYTKNESHLDAKGWHEARLVVRDYEISLRQELGLEIAPRFIEAFEIDILGMTVTASPSQLIDWWTNRRKRARVSFLSEFARASADTRIDDVHNSRKLVSLACPI